MRAARRRAGPADRIAALVAALVLASATACACRSGPARAPAASAAAEEEGPPIVAAADPSPAGSPSAGDAEDASAVRPTSEAGAPGAAAAPEASSAPGGPAAPPGAADASSDEGAPRDVAPPGSEAPADVVDPLGEEDPLGDDAWLEDDWLEDAGPTPAQRDPWEPMNRPLHGFNEAVQEWFFDPLASAYAFAVPGAGRRAIYRFFDNLGEPVNFVNHLFQLEPVDAGATGARFLVNTTVGLVGLFDPAHRFGLEQRPTDFGQTLALYRVGSGPYVVLPMLGPSTVRDALGTAVDAFMRPDVWFFGFSPQLITLTAGEGLAVYEAEQERIDALRQSSIDFYSALRAAYLMNRDARVEARVERVCGGARPPAEEAPAVAESAPGADSDADALPRAAP